MSAIRIRVTVEPHSRNYPLTEVIEVDAAEVEGLEPKEREAYLQNIAEETANELAPWGWTELPEAGDDGE